VINCFAFDSQASLKYTWTPGTVCDQTFAGQTRYSITSTRGGSEGNAAAIVQNGNCVYPVIDTAMSKDGAGSLKFTIPSNSNANSSGFFTEPFAGVGNPFAYIAPGSPLGNVVYWQFYQR